MITSRIGPFLRSLLHMPTATRLTAAPSLEEKRAAIAGAIRFDVALNKRAESNLRTRIAGSLCYDLTAAALNASLIKAISRQKATANRIIPQQDSQYVTVVFVDRSGKVLHNLLLEWPAAER